MAAGVQIKHKRKAGAFVNGELAAGEMGLDTTNSVWYFSTNGTTVQSISTGGSANITQTEIDFGTTPLSEQTFTVTDAGVSGASQIMAQVAWEAPTGKDIDEIEMDDLQIRCKPAAGSFDMFIRAADGSYLADKFKINYLVG